MTSGKRLLLLATARYSINLDDFWMFYRRTGHQPAGFLYHRSLEAKSWWRRNRFRDPARKGVFDPLDRSRMPFIAWDGVDDLKRALDRLGFDYLCMGNGSGADQRQAVEHVGEERCLFSEYGWLPWNENFYISRRGCGRNSDIFEMTAADLAGYDMGEPELAALRGRFSRGLPVPWRDYVYVPLQKDVNDFKFGFTRFRDNTAFLDFIHEVVPPGLTVLIRRHPLYRKRYDLRRYGRFRDISPLPLSKAGLYRHMRAMVCINSTSILEAVLFARPVFAYGEDLFLNKGVVHWGVETPAAFSAALDSPYPAAAARAFVALLRERQVDRKRCVGGDEAYIRGHYWNRSI